MRGEGGLREDGGWSTGACVLTSVYPHPGRVLTDVAKRTLRVDLLKHRTPAAYTQSFIYAREEEPLYYIDGLHTTCIRIDIHETHQISDRQNQSMTDLTDRL